MDPLQECPKVGTPRYPLQPQARAPFIYRQHLIIRLVFTAPLTPLHILHMIQTSWTLHRPTTTFWGRIPTHLILCIDLSQETNASAIIIIQYHAPV
jgi:hypothetical protein